MSKSEISLKIISLQRSKQHKEAKELFENSESMLSELEKLEILGNVAFYNRDFQKAVNLFQEAILQDQSYTIAPYHYLVGFTHVQKNELVEGFKRFQESIEIDPTFVEALIELGAILMKVEDFAAAVRCYTDALKIEPTELGNYHNLLAAYQQLDKTEPNTHTEGLHNAIQAFEKAKSELPEPEDVFLWKV